jgi:hypothetical protein
MGQVYQCWWINKNKIYKLCFETILNVTPRHEPLQNDNEKKMQATDINNF